MEFRGIHSAGVRKPLTNEKSPIQKEICHVLSAKPNEELPIKRTSITLEDPVYETGQQIASKRGFGQSFSAYIAWLIQRDADGGVTREDASLPVRAKAAPKAAPKAVKKSAPKRASKRK